MEINRNNYETFFLLYLDRELNSADRQEVESFLIENADLQKEFALLQQTVFVPAALAFEQKESLYRREEKRKVIPFYWMRIAAAAAVLIIGSWLFVTKPFKTQAGGNGQLQKISSVQKIVLPDTRKGDKGNHVSLSDPEIVHNQPGLVKNATSAPIKSFKNSASAVVQLKSEAMLPQKTSVMPDKQKAEQGEIPAEPLLAMKKMATPELQSADNTADRDPKQVVAMSGADATALVLASAGKTEQLQYEETVLKDNEYPSDNAISVVSLNNNKGISGFFKKITKRTPADDQTRKLRVSVFQISY